MYRIYRERKAQCGSSCFVSGWVEMGLVLGNLLTETIANYPKFEYPEYTDIKMAWHGMA